MSENPIEQIFSDLLPYFEAIEAQSAAILQLLRDKQIATNEELAGYLERAEEGSSVKWRAARVRMEHLFAISSESTAKPKTEVDIEKAEENSDRSKLRPDRTKAEQAAAASSAEVKGQSVQSQQDVRVPKKEREKPPAGKHTGDDVQNDAAANFKAADVQESESSENGMEKAA